jgi:peptidoglycan/xylan/chitin deacetylase (PgdA/CDA1 family)
MTYALIYHDIATGDERDSVGFPGPVAGRYKLEPEHFEAHLAAIAGTGAEVSLWDAGSRDRPSVALTFDDGGASALLAAEALEQRGWRGHFFVTTRRIGTPGFLSADQVRELSTRGHLVGSHSHTHPTYMGRLPHEEIEREWRESRDVLAGLLGAPPETASVPGGFVTRAVFECAAAAGYRLLMTSDPVARTRSVNGLTVAGRYTIWASTPAATAAAFARGDRLARVRLWLEWNAKQRAKRISPRAFEALRRVRARRA